MRQAMIERSSTAPVRDDEENAEDSMKILRYNGYIESNPEYSAPMHTYGQGYEERRPSDGTPSPFMAITMTGTTNLGTIKEEKRDGINIGIHLSKLTMTLLFLGIFILAGSLAIGLGVGLSDRGRKSPTVERELYGAYNGSGIVALDLGNITKPNITTYSQNVNGTIVKSEFFNGTWLGGTDDDSIMAMNARNGTPLMGLSYVNDDELTVSHFLGVWKSTVRY